MQQTFLRKFRFYRAVILRKIIDLTVNAMLRIAGIGLPRPCGARNDSGFGRDNDDRHSLSFRASAHTGVGIRCLSFVA